MFSEILGGMHLIVRCGPKCQQSAGGQFPFCPWLAIEDEESPQISHFACSTWDFHPPGLHGKSPSVGEKRPQTHLNDLPTM